MLKFAHDRFADSGDIFDNDYYFDNIVFCHSLRCILAKLRGIIGKFFAYYNNTANLSIKIVIWNIVIMYGVRISFANHPPLYFTGNLGRFTNRKVNVVMPIEAFVDFVNYVVDVAKALK